MPGFLVLVFWVWLAVALGTFVYRLVTTGSLRSNAPRRAPDPTDTKQATADRFAAFEATLPPPVVHTTAAHPTTPPVSPATQSPASDRPETLAEALRGIEMPADLIPVAGNDIDPRNMIFSTETADPASVGAALADELERLGYELQPLDDRSIAAVRGPAQVEVRLLPDDIAAMEGPLVGRVPRGSVIAEFKLG